MAKQIFVNMAVKDLKRSIGFFEGLGFKFNLRSTDDKAGCLVIGENIYAMLLVEDFFRSFTKKEISDAKKNTEVLIATDAESRDAVDLTVKKAAETGGTI